tara:strand:- start:2590 stop:3705 length:1116 start_codon:yes stop_codon:yes gene_type:complete
MAKYDEFGNPIPDDVAPPGYTRTDVGGQSIFTPEGPTKIYTQATPQIAYEKAAEVLNRAKAENNRMRAERATPDPFSMAVRRDADLAYEASLPGVAQGRSWDAPRTDFSSGRGSRGWGSESDVESPPLGYDGKVYPMSSSVAPKDWANDAEFNSTLGALASAKRDNVDIYNSLIDNSSTPTFTPDPPVNTEEWGYGPDIGFPTSESSSPWDEESNTNRLNEFYKTNLGREVGDQGKSYWLGNLARGVEDWDSVESNILLNDEYTRRQDVGSAFSDAYDRPATEEELDQYVGPGGVWQGGISGLDDLQNLLGELDAAQITSTARRGSGKNQGGLRGSGHKSRSKSSSSSSSSGPSSNSRRGTSGQGRKGRNS